MNVVRSLHSALGIALVATALSLPTAGQAQNSIYSIQPSSVPPVPAGDALSLCLLNGTGGAYADSQIYWVILGEDPNNGNQWSYVDSNGTIHPISTALNTAPGCLVKNGVDYANIDFPVVSGKWIGIPEITAARMYYSIGTPLYIETNNTGYAGPSIDNPSDPNADTIFDWSEFTIDSGGYHGNTTRVDMFGIPLQMRVIANSGAFDQTTGELETQTRNQIFSEYQSAVPSQFQSLGTVQAPYRIIAPIHGSFAAGGANANYFAPYTTAYSTQDILAATGLLATDSPDDSAINRHVWTLPQADWSVVSDYYQAAPANYYAAFWHTVAINSLAYGMPYDDNNGQSSYVSTANPQGVIFRIGWNTPVTAQPLFFMYSNSSGKVVDLANGNTSENAPVDQWAYVYGSLNQYWSLTPTIGGHFEISPYLDSTKCFCINGGSTSNGATTVIYTYVGNPDQQWDLIDAGNGLFNLRNVKSGLMLDLDSGSTANGAITQQWQATGGTNQQWYLQPFGSYYFQSATGKYINCAGAGSGNGTPVIQYDFQTNPWFQWYFNHDNNGWFGIRSINSLEQNLTETISTGSYAAAAACDIWNDVGNPDQEIRIEPLLDGRFKFYNALTGMSWDIPGGAIGDSVPLDQYPNNTNPWQEFYMQRVP